MVRGIEYCSKDEIETERTPSELWGWLIQKVNQICATQEGLKALRLQNDKEKLIKKLVEEIAPLAIFRKHKFGDTDQVLLKPVIGNQDHDAIINDLRTNPASQSYLEITQAHEGEDDYWRRCELLKKGYDFSEAPVIKKGKGKRRTVSIPPAATPVEEGVKKELERIITAAKGKTAKDSPANTSLIIFFDDTTLSEERLKVLNYPTIDYFVKKELMNLDLRFSHLYLVGKAKEVFREFPFKR